MTSAGGYIKYGEENKETKEESDTLIQVNSKKFLRQIEIG